MSIGKLMGSVGVGLSLVLAMACTGDNGGEGVGGSGAGATTSTSTSTTGGGGTTTTSNSTNTGGEGPTCPPPEPAGPGVEYTMGEVKGKVLDLQGNPAANILSDVCGTNLCISGETDENGVFVVNVDPDTKLVDVALISGNGRRFVKMCGQIPNKPDHDFGTIHTVKLPEFAKGTPFPASGDVSHGGVTFTIPEGAAVKHDIIIYTDESERVLRTVTFKPDDGNFPAITPDKGFALMIGTAPINTTICPAAKLTFDNTEGWAPGAEVEIWYNGYNTFFHWAPYGEWGKVAEGVVSDDGKTVSTKDGEGIVELGLFGIKLK